MTAHAESHVATGVHTGEGNTNDERLQAALALKFEPSEVQDFEAADRAAGQMMGKLLAFLFCVLLFLMTGVNIWMMSNAAKGTDPQAELSGEVTPNGAAPAHH